jgi:hypothetical protein
MRAAPRLACDRVLRTANGGLLGAARFSWAGCRDLSEQRDTGRSGNAHKMFQQDSQNRHRLRKNHLSTSFAFSKIAL